MQEVNWDDLEDSPDALLVIYRGAPFTGTAVETIEGGRLVTSAEYFQGKKRGALRVWNSAGQLVKDKNFALDALHGTAREWYDSGSLKSEGLYELGICIKKIEWMENGRVLSEYHLTDDEPNLKLLKALRASNLGELVRSWGL